MIGLKKLTTVLAFPLVLSGCVTGTDVLMTHKRRGHTALPRGLQRPRENA